MSSKLSNSPILTAALVLAAMTCGSSYDDVHAQEEVTKQFHGIWRLVSWVQRLDDGTTRQAPNSVGTASIPTLVTWVLST